ncbi:MAG: MiaB/RimO family radical SAM methylthiotransferase [bacterium]|nr:MiaB/RimO family radical SAM methylthiotransferase [bacterium]
MPKYYIITFGCQMNKSDSERIVTVLENMGYKSASDISGADLIVVNMCSVRQSAVDRVYGLAPKFKKLKIKNEKLKTVLAGCILKKDKKKFREIFDSIWNMRNYFDISQKCKSKSLAFVPISNGCNNLCTYCVVPYTRGPLVCRNHQEVLKEVKDSVKKGFKEIWFLGQNVNDYQSSTDTSINFAKLLKMINDIPDDFKILFISPHPKNFSDELINILAKCEKFGKYLNLPVQSGDDKILKKMNRNYTVKEYKNLVKKIRKKMPGIRLSTDVIVGFPGETKKQFQNTVKLFKEIKFDNAYISKYSPRPGTAAFNLMKNNIPLAEKKKREKILREIIENRNSLKMN